MNKIILLGRMCKDSEVRYTPSGKVVAQFTLAVDRPFVSQDGQREADFAPCIWGKQAETFGNTVHKGQRVLVEGRLQIRSYDGKDGQKRWVSEVVCDRYEYIERKENGSQNANTGVQRGGFGTMGSQVPFDDEVPFAPNII